MTRLRQTFDKDGKGKGEVVVVLLGAGEIREMNRVHLGRDCATDVLAFDLREDEGSATHIGDDSSSAEIYVCLDVAVDAAQRYNTTVGYEAVLYIVHGFLHLVGYDDHAATGAHAMRRTEAETMAELGGQFDINAIFAC